MYCKRSHKIIEPLCKGCTWCKHSKIGDNYNRREERENEFSDWIRSGRPAAAMREDKAKEDLPLITAARRMTSKLPNP